MLCTRLRDALALARRLAPSIPGYTWYTFMVKSDPSTPPAAEDLKLLVGGEESNSAACFIAVVCLSAERSPSTRYRRFDAT